MKLLQTVLPFLKFQKGKGTITTLALGLLVSFFQHQFGVDLQGILANVTTLDPQVQTLGWQSALIYFLRRALAK